MGSWPIPLLPRCTVLPGGSSRSTHWSLPRPTGLYLTTLVGATTRVWKTDVGTNRQTLRSWRKTEKQRVTVCWTWDHMLRLPSAYSQVGRMMTSVLILHSVFSSWCCRLAQRRRRRSILLMLSWRQLDCIQLCTLSMHADRSCWRSYEADSLLEQYTCVSSA